VSLGKKQGRLRDRTSQAKRLSVAQREDGQAWQVFVLGRTTFLNKTSLSNSTTCGLPVKARYEEILFKEKALPNNQDNQSVSILCP
jgi:hypothetical protein